MLIRFTQDIHTQQPVYAICTSNGTCKYLTTSITQAIQLSQTNVKD